MKHVRLGRILKMVNANMMYDVNHNRRSEEIFLIFNLSVKILDNINYHCTTYFQGHQFLFFQGTMYIRKTLGTSAILTATVNIPGAAFWQRITTVLRFQRDLDIARAQGTYVATILEMAVLQECVLLQV